MTTDKEVFSLIEILSKAGFTNGYALNGTNLVLWEHDEDPPKPLTRPEAQ